MHENIVIYRGKLRKKIFVCELMFNNADKRNAILRMYGEIMFENIAILVWGNRF